jgi:hypothetical protein
MAFDSITWAAAEGEFDNHPLLMTFREIPETFPKSNYPHRLNIFWTMSEPDENGLLTEQEFPAIEVFEDRLLQAVEHDEQSILVCVITCNGQREYIFYTADVEGFRERLTDMPQAEERYPIEIHRYDDPGWNYFESVILKE